MKDLYIVSTYYHALISCIKQMRSSDKADIMVTEYIPGYRSLADKIKESGIFEFVYCVGKINEYIPKNRLDFIFCLHRKNSYLIESQLDIPLKKYDNIHIFHDDTWFAHYLKCAGISYILTEDSLDSYKIISKTAFSHMLHKADIKAWVKNTFRIGYVFCGYDKYTKSVEVNSIDGVEIKHLAGKKLVEQPRKPMLDSLSPDELEKLKKIFLKEIPDIDYSRSVLLITQPLFEDGIVLTEEDQLRVYQKIIYKYSKGYSLVVKPHPRDNADYSCLSHDVVILDKNMPLEIIVLILNPHFAKVVSISSSCLHSIGADEYINESIML